MEEIGKALLALAGLGPLGIALTTALVLAVGAVATLLIAWKRGFFRSHYDLVRSVQRLSGEIRALDHRIAADLRRLDEKVDVLSVDHAKVDVLARSTHETMGEIRTTLQRLDGELGKLQGSYSTLLAVAFREPTPPGGNRADGEPRG